MMKKTGAVKRPTFSILGEGIVFMVSTKRAQKGFATFLDKEMMNKLPANSVQKTAVGVASGLMLKKGGDVMEGLKDNPLMMSLGVFDETGKMDIDLLRDVLRENIPETGVKIKLPIIGYMTIHKADVDALHRYISETPEVM